MTDYLEWLEKTTENGWAPALLYDDNGHWTVTFQGHQSCAFGEHQDVKLMHVVKADDWHDTIEEAFEAAIEHYEEFQNE
jgi:hypothetical protein